MEKSCLLFILMLLFPGCQPQKEESVFADWQPPPVRDANPQSGLQPLLSDVVLPQDIPGPAVMPRVYAPSDVLQPTVSLIIVSITDQRLWAWSGDKLLKEFRVSTAASGLNLVKGQKSDSPHNHLGSFVIDRKDIDHVSGQYNCPMPYALHYFEGHWIHATEPKFYPLLGRPASHGCVRLHLNDAKWLYSHTPVGCQLVIEE